jgi:hypothetical protein
MGEDEDMPMVSEGHPALPALSRLHHLVVGHESSLARMIAEAEHAGATPEEIAQVLGTTPPTHHRELAVAGPAPTLGTWWS